MANEIQWSGPSLSDRVAEQIIRYRNRPSVDLTREQLAERCKELGAPGLTFAALTNIETGRRKDGRRRRDITVDELVVIARALRVPPILLVFPLGTTDLSEIVPGVEISTRSALEWFAGNSAFPTVGDPGGGKYDPATGLRDWYNDPEADWEVGAAPTILFDKHHRLHQEWASAASRANQLYWNDAGELDDAASKRAALRWRSEAERELRSVRADMRRHGLKPPKLPDYLEHIDGDPS